MKKTIWLPLALGSGMGLLAGLVNIGNLSYMSPSGWPIGFYNVFLFLAAALGGPLGGVSEIIMITMINWFGPIEWRIAISPELYWANVLTEGVILLPLLGLGYRAVFRRFKIPLRLLPWAGMIIGFYALDVVLIPFLWWLFSGQSLDAGFLENIVSGYQSWFPQIISDIILTSLIWLSIPERWRKPLWGQPEQPAAATGVEKA